MGAEAAWELAEGWSPLGGNKVSLVPMVVAIRSAGGEERRRPLS